MTIFLDIKMSIYIIINAPLNIVLSITCVMQSLLLLSFEIILYSPRLTWLCSSYINRIFKQEKSTQHLHHNSNIFRYSCLTPIKQCDLDSIVELITRVCKTTHPILSLCFSDIHLRLLKYFSQQKTIFCCKMILVLNN